MRKHPSRIHSNIQNFTPSLAQPSALQDVNSISHGETGRDQRRRKRIKDLGTFGAASRGMSVWPLMTDEQRNDLIQKYCPSRGEPDYAFKPRDTSLDDHYAAVALFTEALLHPDGLLVDDATYALEYMREVDGFSLPLKGWAYEAHDQDVADEAWVYPVGPQLSLLAFTALTDLRWPSLEKDRDGVLRKLIAHGAKPHVAIWDLAMAYHYDDLPEGVDLPPEELTVWMNDSENFELITPHEEACLLARDRIYEATR